MPAPLSFVDLEGILTGMRMLACVSLLRVNRKAGPKPTILHYNTNKINQSNGCSSEGAVQATHAYLKASMWNTGTTLMNKEKANWKQLINISGKMELD